MSEKLRQISDQELANYVVCPQAWYLKSTQTRDLQVKTEHAQQSKLVRQQWHDKNSLLLELHGHRKSIYLLLLGIVVFLLALEVAGLRWTITGGQAAIQGEDHTTSSELISNPTGSSSSDSIPFEIAALVGLVGIAVFIYDRLESKKQQISEEVGFADKTKQIENKEGEKQTTKNLFSATLGIVGKPDALVLEGKKLVPIIFQPFGKKVQDRHVIKLIAYQTMLQESGENSDYGVLILGEKQRRVEIMYSEQKKEWLVEVLSEMRKIISGDPAIAAPSKFKCRNCDVRGLCTFRATSEKSQTPISQTTIKGAS